MTEYNASDPQAWLSHCPAPALLVGPDGRIAGVSIALAEILPEAGKLVGHALSDVAVEKQLTQGHGELHLGVAGGSVFDAFAGTLPGGWTTCVLLPRSLVVSRRLATQLAVAETLAGASDLPAAAPTVVEALCRSEGWCAGVLWRVAPGGNLLAAASWSRPDLEGESLARLLGAERPRLSETASGKLFGSHQPWWLSDLGLEPGWDRAALARAAGFVSGCSLPIVRDGEPWAVLELWSTRAQHADPATLQHLTAVASQLGQFAQRVESDRTRQVSEGRLATVLANAPLVLFVFDENGRIEACTGAGVPDPEQWVGKNLLVELPENDVVRQSLCSALAGEAVSTVLESTQAAGRIFQLRYQPVADAAGKVTGVIGVGVDVTEQRAQEEKLKLAQARELASERLVSLGTLSAGVAHEINNPLTYIQLNLGRLISLERAVTPPAPMTLHRLETLQEIREGVNHVAHIVKDLQVFSRGRRADGGDKVAEVETGIQAALRLADHEIRHRARVVREGDPVPAVRGEPERLAQLFLNLLLNAVQAIGDGDAEHNEVVVTTRQAGDMVEIEFRDTGSGIAPDVLPRIFDPFFTTRHGTGTGLGLFLSHDFVSSLGGTIEVTSQPGQGATFVVRLPVAPAEVQTQPASAPAARSGRRGRVLVVDDDRGVASAIAAFLGDHHEVRVAGSGRESLTILRADTDFDAILCDLMMIDLTGMDVFDVLRQERPAMAERMIFMTAGASTQRARDFLASTANAKIDKPLDLPRLLSLIDERVSYRHEWLATATPPARAPHDVAHASPPRRS